MKLNCDEQMTETGIQENANFERDELLILFFQSRLTMFKLKAEDVSIFPPSDYHLGHWRGSMRMRVGPDADRLPIG